MTYNPIPHSLLRTGVSYHRPDNAGHAPVSLDSPALDCMTDLKRVVASTIAARESIDEALAKMKRRGVRMLLVVDLHDAILGIVTATDINGEKPMKFLQHNGGTHKDITVKDIMVPDEEIEVLTIKDVSTAKVGDVVETLQQTGHQHAVVVDNQGPNNETTVRGIFSLNQIARQLGINLQKFEVPHTLAEIARHRGN